MRRKLWDFDTVQIDLEDRDVTVTAVYALTFAEIKICFRLTTEQLQGEINAIREPVETLAADKV